MLTIQFKQYLIVGLFLITGYFLFLPQVNLTDVFLLFILPTLFILQINDLIALKRNRTAKISRSVLTTTDIIFISIFCFEFFHLCFAESYIPTDTTNLLAVILIYLGGRAYLNNAGLKWLAYGITLIGIIVAISLLYTCCEFYHTMLQEGFIPGNLVSLRFLLNPNGVMINDWAGISLVFLPFSIYTLYHASSYWKYIALPCPWIISLAIIYTLSRGAILAWILFVFIVIITAVKYRVRFSTHRAFRWATIGCFILFLFCLVPVSEMLFSLTATDSNSVQMQSAIGRLDRWEQIWGIIREHPWDGIGNGNYGGESLIISNQTGASYTGRVNNLLLQIMLEKGMGGFLVYCVLLICIITRTVKHICVQVKNNRQNQAFITIVLLSGLCALFIREMTFTTLFQEPICLYFTVLLILMLSFPSTPERSVRVFMPVQQLTLFLALVFWFEASCREQRQSHVSRYNNLAIEALEAGDREKALQSIDSAIEVQPDNPILWNNKALFLSVVSPQNNSGHRALSTPTIPLSTLKEALASFRTASAYQPQEPMFLHNAGWISLALKDTLTGKRYIEQALHLAPHAPLYLIGLGKYYEQNDSLSEAVKLYAKALVISPGLIHTSFFVDFSKSYPQEVQQVLCIARNQLKQKAILTQDCQTMAKWATLELQLKDTTLATRMLDSVVKCYPNLSRAWMTLGSIYESVKPNQAYQCYRKAYILDKWDPLIAYKLGHFLEINGDTTQSAVCYRQALNDQQHVLSDQTLRFYRIYGIMPWIDGHYPRNLFYSILPLVDLQNKSPNHLNQCD